MEGSRWQTTYYHQVLDQSNEPSPQQLNKEAIYQQYTKINQFELRVNQELSQSQNTESGSFDVTGSATVYPPVIPNRGDMFLADIGDGREGLFALTNVERRTMLKQACFQIEYVLVSEATETRRKDLESKTIQETYYVESYLEHGQNPVVIAPEYQQQRSLNELYQDLIGQFLGDFYDRRLETLLVPHQEHLTYDALVVKAILAILDTTDHKLIQHIKDLNVNGLREMRSQTIWDCLLDVTDDTLPLCIQTYQLIESRAFGTYPYYEGVYFSGVERVLCPEDPYGGGDLSPDHVPEYLKVRLRKGQPRRYDTDGTPEYDWQPGETGIKSLPDIHPVTHDTAYVFSEGFYRNSPTSKLEVLVSNTLAHKPIDLGVLCQLAEQSRDWQSLERFYYVPVLMMLLKIYRRELS